MDVPFENVVSLTFGSVVPGAGGNTLLECTVKYSNGVEEALCVHSDVAFYGDGRTLPGPYSSVQPTLLKTILFASPASVGVNAAKVP